MRTRTSPMSTIGIRIDTFRRDGAALAAIYAAVSLPLFAIWEVAQLPLYTVLEERGWRASVWAALHCAVAAYTATVFPLLGVP